MPPTSLRFDAFEVDLKAGELRKQGHRVRLQEKPFQLLQALLEERGRIVTRDELRSRLWPSDTFVDFDNGLNNAANKLRTALSDSAERPRFIETVGRRGYRFIGALDPGGDRTDADRDRSDAREVRSIAVLPLVNLSSDPEQEYFSDGLTDALIAQIAGIRSLHVISRQSIVRYKRSPLPMPQIARELGVDALIEGTVMRSGGRVRISAQLVHGPQDRHLWSESFERELSDILVVQSEIARAVADAVAATVTRDEASRLARVEPLNPSAYDAYLKGRFFWRQRSRDGLLRSVEYFRKAIALAPSFALAHAAAAESYGPLGYLGFLPPEETTPAMRAAATRALELDPDLVEALTAIAACESFHEWRWREGEAHFRRAIAVNPNYSTAYLWYGLLLEIEGRFDESLVARQRGLDLDPLYLRAQTEVGWGLFMAGRVDEGIADLRGVLELEPDYYFARRALGIIDVCAGRYDAAVAGFEATGDDGAVGHALAAAGRVDEARAALTRLEQQARSVYVSPVRLALVHLGLGNQDRAIAELERAFEARAIDLAAVGVDPRFAKLRDDPRVHALMRRLDLP